MLFSKEKNSTKQREFVNLKLHFTRVEEDSVTIEDEHGMWQVPATVAVFFLLTSFSDSKYTMRLIQPPENGIELLFPLEEKVTFTGWFPLEQVIFQQLGYPYEIHEDQVARVVLPVELRGKKVYMSMLTESDIPKPTNRQVGDVCMMIA